MVVRDLYAKGKVPLWRRWAKAEVDRCEAKFQQMCVMGHQPLHTTSSIRTAHLATHAQTIKFQGIASSQGEIGTAFGLLLK